MADSDLPTFLLARYDEAEAIAKAVEVEMHRVVEAGHYKRTALERRGLGAEEGYDGFPLLAASPARVLADIAAKRRIVETLDKRRRREGLLNLTEESVLRSLAAVYADHPDYREEWRP